MKKFSQHIKESAEGIAWATKFEEDHDVYNAAKDAVSASLDSMMYDKQLNLRNIEELREQLKEGIHIDTTHLLHFSLEREIDFCMYAEEIDQEECPKTSYELLTQVISNRAVDGLRYIADKLADTFCDRLDLLTDAYNLHDFRLSDKDPFESYPPHRVDTKGHFSVTTYLGLDNDNTANYDVYHFGEEKYPNFYLISKH